MKNYFFIAGFMVAGLFLEASQGLRILDRIEKEKGVDYSAWESTGPTAEDIQAATKVKNPAVKGSREEKLINALKSGNLKNVGTFIADGADLEATDSRGMTALMIAAENGHTNIVTTLIAAGANVNAHDKFNLTALMIAANKRHADIVKTLIAAGDTTDRERFKEILLAAVYQRDTETVKALIVEHARIDDETFDTAYSQASMGRNRNPEYFNFMTEARNKRYSIV